MPIGIFQPTSIVVLHTASDPFTATNATTIGTVPTTAIDILRLTRINTLLFGACPVNQVCIYIRRTCTTRNERATSCYLCANRRVCCNGQQHHGLARPQQFVTVATQIKHGLCLAIGSEKLEKWLSTAYPGLLRYKNQELSVLR